MTYALLPTTFMVQWNAWTASPTTNSRPESIDTRFLLCEHGLLNVDPSREVDLDSDLVWVIKYDHWLSLADRRGFPCFILC